MDVGAVELVAFDGASGFVGETARGGPVDNKGHIVEATGNHAPMVETAAGYTIPIRTPFALTGSATDFDGDTLTYMWEQNDRGGTRGARPALTNNVKANGPLFRQFGTAANVTADGHAAVAVAGPQRGRHEPDPRVPGHGADPGQQHQRRDAAPARRGRRRRPRSRPRSASASRSSCRPPTTSASSTTGR